MKTTTFLLILLCNFWLQNSFGQQNVLINQGGTVSVSTGDMFYDAGGAAGNDGNTSYTITLSPAIAGQMVCLDFTYFKTMFNSSSEDALFIYDGATATGNDIGKLMGDYSIKTGSSSTPYGVGRGIANSADVTNIFRPTLFSATNPTGCLTLKFVNGSSSQYPGWIANITTYTPLSTPGCNITTTADQTNICSGQTATLTATATVVSAGINTNFNSSAIGTGWASSPAVSFTSSVCSAPALDGSVYLWMQAAAAPRELKTNNMDLSNGGTISFEYRQAKYNSDPSPCEAPDILMSGTTNEGVFVQYSTDNGSTWTTLKYLFSNSIYSNSGTADAYNNGCGDYVTRWTKMMYPIPAAAMTTSTQFRWIQPAETSASTDNWGLDNIIIATPKTSTITWKNLATNTLIGTSPTSPYTISVSPTVTTTYEATISDGTTSCSSQITITVGSGITPTFNQVAAICAGDALNPLTTVSTNGITGSWAPALNNITTTTYTFTPNTGQCATSTTMTITVNNATTPTFTQVAAICAGGALNPLPTVSTNGITGSWAPTLNNATTTTYTFTPNAGQCATTTTMTITVNSATTPTFTQVAAICTGGVLNPLPTVSTNGISGSWAPALNNAATTTYTFSPNAGQCATSTTMTITVNSATTSTFTQVAAICTGEALNPLPTGSTNGITGSWAPALNNATTTTYTFTPNGGQCASTTTMTITVNSATTPTFTQVAAICAGDPLNPLPTVSTNGITGSWAPALNNTAITTYTFTPNAGQCANTTTMTITVNSITTPAFNQVPAICSGGNLNNIAPISTNGITGTWSPAIDNTVTTTYTFIADNGQCAANTAMTITVNPLPAFTVIDPNPICEPLTLDLTSLSITNGGAGTFTYYTDPSAVNQVADPTSVGNSGIYYIQNQLNGCSFIQPVNVVVDPMPTALFTASPNELDQFNSTSTMVNNSLDAISFQWFFEDGTTSVLDSPVHTFIVDVPGEQSITLVATSTNGCTDTVTETIKINEVVVYYVPNSFTPDEDRGNTRFSPVFSNPELINTYTLQIFNRWGELVFESSNPSCGWDGKGKSTTESAMAGTYTWTIDFSESLYNTRKRIAGHVNLLK